MDQAETLRRMFQQEPRGLSVNHPGFGSEVRVIAFTNGKAGISRATAISQLGWVLNGLGRRVIILDGDIDLASPETLKKLIPNHHLHILMSEKPLSEAAIEGPGGMMILPTHSGERMTAQDGGKRLQILGELLLDWLPTIPAVKNSGG